LGTLLHDPNLWHLNRRTVSGAFAIGLFVAWIPVPFQMVLAALAAILVRVNLPISAILVWISNPFTLFPMFYFAYRVGATMMGVQTLPFAFELSFDWLVTELVRVWRPFLLGCFLMGCLSALAGYATVRTLWRLYVLRRLAHKRNRNAVR
jgi:uncharacterized protein (DUF2062 family)